MISVENLEVALGEQRILTDVNLQVSPGEFVGLVGPNGAGKTTLLRAINGRLDADSGTVRLDGDRTAALSAREISRRVATVHQETNVQFAFDVATIVAMGRTPHRSRLGGDPTGTEQVEHALDRTDVAHLRERRISEVSGGERQRVFLARALAQDAPALLLDEPTASLDLNHAARTLSLVRELVADGKAALGAIHDLDAAARYCDRLIVLSAGGVVARGTPEEVLTSETLQAAFDARTIVTPNPATGRPSVTVLPRPATTGRRIHVLGGGSVAARIVSDLWAEGHRVTVGPVPTGDTTTTVARSLDVETLTAPGFTHLDDATLARARELLSEADVVVFADPVVTPGLPVLSLAEDVTRPILVEARPFSERNFAGEDGDSAYSRLQARSRPVTVDGVVDAVTDIPETSKPTDSSR